MLTEEVPRPRTTTGDLTVQTHSDIDGLFHRKAIGGHFTACGQEIDHRKQSNWRLEQYDLLLCKNGCFSSFELGLGLAKKEG